MTSQTDITITIPTGVDAAAIQAAALAAVREQQRGIATSALIEKILTDDTFFNERYKNMAVVRANTYDDGYSPLRSRFESINWWWISNRRKPVPMRGSLDEMIARYGWSHHHCANGLATEIVRRYLRRIKWTCFDIEEHYKFATRLEQRMREKFHLSYHFEVPESTHLYWRYNSGIWLNGKFRYGLTSHQISYLKKLHKLREALKRNAKSPQA